MRILFTFCLLFLTKLLYAQISTSGDQSPAVIAENIRITYGISPNITHELIEIYKKEGYSSIERNEKVKLLISKYKALSNKNLELTREQKTQLGILDKTEISNVLNYDIFMSTKGFQSPAIYSPGGYSEIWYGISPSAFKGIWKILEEKQVHIEDFTKKLEEQIEKYNELEIELTERSEYDKTALVAKHLLNQGKIAEAEHILEMDLIENNKKTAYRNYEVGKIKDLVFKFREASEYFLNATRLDKFNPTYHLCYGNVLFKMEKYNESITQYIYSLDLYKKIALDSNKIAKIYKNIGMSYRKNREYDKSIYYLNEALKIENILDDSTAQIEKASIFNALANVYIDKKNQDSAMIYLNNALHLYTDTIGGKIKINPNISNTYNSLGIYLFEYGNYEDAMVCFKTSLFVDSIFYGKNNPNYIIGLNNIGELYKKFHSFEMAIAFFNEAETISREILDTIHPIYIRTILNLGETYILKKDYYNSTKKLEKIINLSLNPDLNNSLIYWSILARTYNAFGKLHSDKNEHIKAIIAFKKALNIELNKFNNLSYHISTAYNNIGMEYFSLVEYDSALYYLNKSIIVCHEIYSEPNLDFAVQYNNLGLTYTEKKEFVKAIEFYNKALKVRNKFEQISPEFADLYYNVALAYSKSIEYNISMDYFKKALAMYLKLYKVPHKRIAETNFALGTINLSIGDDFNAKHYFDEALINYEQLLALGDLSAIGPISLIKLAKKNTIGNERSISRRKNSFESQKLQTQYDKQRDTLIELDNSSWSYLLKGNFNKSEELSRNLLSQNSTSKWLNKNLSHALLFQNRWKETKTIYKNLGTCLHYDGRLLYRVMLEDLAAIEMAGHKSKYLKKAYKFLNKKTQFVTY